MICSCCNEFFEKGTGHACFCPDCNKVHPFCQECYDEAKRLGSIKDVKYKKTDASKKLDEKLV